MSRVSDKQGTKAGWRRGETRTYGVAAARRERLARERANAEHTAKIERQTRSPGVIDVAHFPEESSAAGQESE